MQTYVAFDVGNVLCHFDIKKFTTKLHEVTSYSHDYCHRFLEHIQKNQDIGLTTVAQSLKYEFNLNDTCIASLIEAWNSTLYTDDAMMRFLENLRSEDVKIAFLSNMGPEHLLHLRTTYPEMFQNAIQHFSCEVGARKPTKLFFQSFVLDNPQFSSPTYVDDIEENLKMGKRYMFCSYHFKLDEVSQMSMSQKKIALDKLKHFIFNKS